MKAHGPLADAQDHAGLPGGFSRCDPFQAVELAGGDDHLALGVMAVDAQDVLVEVVGKNLELPQDRRSLRLPVVNGHLRADKQQGNLADEGAKGDREHLAAGILSVRAARQGEQLARVGGIGQLAPVLRGGEHEGQPRKAPGTDGLTADALLHPLVGVHALCEALAIRADRNVEAEIGRGRQRINGFGNPQKGYAIRAFLDAVRPADHALQ